MSSFYALVLIVYFLGRLILGERWTLIELGNSLMPVLLFPSLIFLLVAILTRRKLLTLLHIPALVAFALLYGPFFLPKNISVSQGTVPLRVLTFNLGSEIQDTDRIVSLIRSVDADILAVQELLSPAAQLLTDAFADRYPYRALHPNNAFASGIGVFSRTPITNDRTLDSLSLGGQRTEVVHNGTSFTLFNVHPTSPRILGGFDSSMRSREIDFVLEIAAQETQPVLILGDFNITDQTDDYARVHARYQDAFRVVGMGFGLSFPNLERFARPLGLLPPMIRIDYVFYSDAWTPIDARVLSDSGGSDHYPLYVELVQLVE